jgi:hypothetical protein
MRYRPRHLIALIVVATCLAGGCGNSEESQQRAEPPIIAERAFAITGAAADKAVVEPGRLTFPLAGNEGLLDKKPGDILVGDRQTTPGAKNPYGFIRKVKTVTQQGDQIVVETDFASITDAIQRGHVSQQVDFPATTPQGFLSPKDTGGLAGGQIDVTGTVLNAFSGGAKAKVSQGHLAFNPKMDIGIDIDWFKVKEFHAIASGKLDMALAVELTATAAAKGEVELPVFEAPPYPLPPQFIGPIPVVETLNFSVALVCSLTEQGESSVNVGASSTTSVSLGARYQNGSWSKVATESFSWAPIGPDLTGKVGIEIKCALQPELALMFYDVVGPYLSMGPYAAFSLSVPPCEWEIKAGIEGNAGGKVEILEYTLAQLELKLFDKSWSLLKGSCGEKDGGTEAGCSLNMTAPAGWTCEAAKYGNCKCDCACGTEDYDCIGQTGVCSDCSHDVCTTGTPLKPACNDCTAKVCAADSFCCNTSWLGSCVMDAQDLCGLCK